MQTAPSDLPQDPTELQALLRETQAELISAHQDLATKKAEIDEVRGTLAHRELEIQMLKLQLAKLRRMQFGRSSEKVAAQINQLELQLEELETPSVDQVAVQRSRPAKAKPVRRPLPEHLPRETTVHTPPCSGCPACGGELKPLGEDVSEILEYVPARFKVMRHVRPKLACGACDEIVQMPAVSRPIAKGLAGPGLLSHVLVSKYCDHLPLYRQSEIYAREGVDLGRSTLADWVGEVTALLAPLNAALSRHVMSAFKLHADDTPFPVLSPGSGKTKLGRLWAYVRDDRPANDPSPPAVLFRYTVDRKGKHPQAHLNGFEGVLQADGYAGFNALYDSGKIDEAACWAHARRKFYDIVQATDSPMAAEAVNRIGALYSIEAEIRGQPPDERRAQRQARAGPLLDSLKAWLHCSLSQVSKKSDLAKAIRYALPRWKALTRYMDDGRIEIDNNAAERAIRAVALGRKNYLFAGSDTGGERAAAMYSLIGTAKLHGMDPQAYLSYVLERIADHPINTVDQLLPWNVADDLDTVSSRR